jgi:hypothetical protein
VQWWESRRWLFNLVHFVVGICSLAVMFAVGGAALEAQARVTPGEDFVEPLAVIFGIPIYALAMNVCYAIGWETEVWTGEIRTPEARARAFRVGLLLSSLVTLLPGLWACVYWLGHKLAN